MSRVHVAMAALALLLAAPQGAGALNAAGVARGAGGDSSAEAARPRANEVNLVQEAEQSLGSFEVRKSVAVEGALQQLRGRVSTFAAEIKVKGPTFAEMFCAGCSYVLTCSIIAVLYRQFLFANPSDFMENLEAQKIKEGFEFPLFSPAQCDLKLAFCSVFCVGLRWSTTVSNERLALITFWPAFFLITCIDGFMGIFGGLLWFVQVGTCVYFRQKIREHYGLPRGTGMTYLEDILSWTCCCLCAVAQEAKQIEYVRSP